MSWTDQYWDIVNEFYWVPSYLGLKSIPKSACEFQGDAVKVPKAMMNPNGPLYRRTRSGDDYWGFVKRQEETFNHILNLTLAALPGDVVSELFAPIVGFVDIHFFDLQGSSIRDRYDWIEGANVTTPDAFLLAEDAILAVELKFNAKASLDQLAKYIALIAGEELHRGPRGSIHLLYIFPEDPERRFETHTSLAPAAVGPLHFDVLRQAVKNQRVRRFYADHEPAVKSALSRLHVSCVSWLDFAERLTAYSQALGATAGDRTLSRLLNGLVSEIYGHPLSRAELSQVRPGS